MATSTISIALQDILGIALSTPVLFTSKSTPQAVGLIVVPTQTKAIQTDSAGEGEIELHVGDYLVTVLGSSFRITVPLGGMDYDLANLITSGAIFTGDVSFRNRNGALQIKNVTTGEWHTLICDTLNGGVSIGCSQEGEA
jgi:hypothetical protein